MTTGVYIRSEKEKQRIKEMMGVLGKKRTGVKLSLARREQMSKSRIGRTPWNKGLVGVVKHSEETKKKMSKSHIGINTWMRGRNIGAKSHLWKGGITKKNKLLRNRAKYSDWRKSVYERDNFTCQICGVRGVVLNADHIKPWALFPKLRYKLSNGRTLCVPCHKKTDTYFWKMNKHKHFIRATEKLVANVKHRVYQFI